jgi:hypothetical protein
MRAFLICLLALIGCAAPQAAAPQTAPNANVPFTLLNPGDYHAFIANPQQRWPLCQAVRSASEWSMRLHPAAVMGANVFGPPATLFDQHVVLLVARTMPSGATEHVFTVNSVTRTPDGKITVDYTYAPPPPGTSTMNYYFAVVVAKPVDSLVQFRENGQVVCNDLRTD